MEIRNIAIIASVVALMALLRVTYIFLVENYATPPRSLTLTLALLSHASHPRFLTAFGLFSSTGKHVVVFPTPFNPRAQ